MAPPLRIDHSECAIDSGAARHPDYVHDWSVPGVALLGPSPAASERLRRSPVEKWIAARLRTHGQYAMRSKCALIGISCLSALVGACGEAPFSDPGRQQAQPLEAPLLAQAGKLAYTIPQEGAQLGRKVILSGGLAVLSAPNAHDNQAYRSPRAFGRSDGVFRLWHDFVTPGGVQPKVPYFGAAMAARGGTLAIGSPSESAVYTYDIGHQQSAYRSKLTGPDWQNCGSAVGVWFSALMVGCAGEFGGPSETVHVFAAVADGQWSPRQELTASDGLGSGSGHQFGASISMMEDTAWIGAPGWNQGQGAVYVFTRNGSTWSETQVLTSDGAPASGFGKKLALWIRDGIATGIAIEAGAAHVFVRQGSQWTWQQRLARSDGGSAFGDSVALDGDLAVIGAADDTVGTNAGQGSVYVFRREGSVWTETQRLTASDGESEDHLGYSVAFEGSTIVAGAWNDDFAQGSAYVFDLPSGILPPNAAPVAIGPSGAGVGNWPAFQFTGVTGATHYGVQWVFGGAGVQVPQSACDPATGLCSVLFYEPLPVAGIRWRVRAENSAGVGPWSNVVEASPAGPATPPPAPPVAISPRDSVAPSRPTFTWNAAPMATYYSLWVSDSISGNEAALRTTHSATETGCEASSVCSLSLPGGPALAPGPARWWVRAGNPLGSGPWSTVASFTVFDASVPPTSAPGLVAPLNTAISSAPTYAWRSVVNATEYELWVSDSSGVRLLRRTYTAAAAGCSMGTNCAVTPTEPAGTGARHWWVLAKNAAGSGPWSPRGSFTIGNTAPPGVAALIAPSGTIATPTPVYSWSAVNGAVRYLLWVNDTGGVRVKRSFSATEAGCEDGTCSVNPGIAIGAGAATWWIQAANEAGPGAWSAGLAFQAPPP
jgi:hypothetical protein